MTSFSSRIVSLFLIMAASLNAAYTSEGKPLEDVNAIVKYRFYYTHTHVRDATKPDVRITENMMLCVGDVHALFVSFDKLVESKAAIDKIAAEMVLTNPEKPIILSERRQVIPQEYITFFEHNKYLTSEYFARQYYIEESRPPIEWEFMEGEQEILGMMAYPAQATYLGRLWTAWFVPELTMPTGPWLLHGLPGLIVKAEDATGEVTFDLIGYESASVENEVLTTLKKQGWDYNMIKLHYKHGADKISRSDFTKLREMRERMGAGPFYSMQSQIMFDRKVFTQDMGTSNPRSWAEPILNPIDLTTLQP